MVEAVLACIVGISSAAVQQPGDPLGVRDTREVRRSGCAPRERHGTVPLDTRGRVSHDDSALPPQRVAAFVAWETVQGGRIVHTTVSPEAPSPPRAPRFGPGGDICDFETRKNAETVRYIAWE